MGESPAPPGSSGRRASTWWVIGGGVACVVAMLVGALLWWKLPAWKPNWVVRYSPWLEPMLRATGSPSFDEKGLLRDRIQTWGPSATPALLRYLDDPKSAYRRLCQSLLEDFGDERAATSMLAALNDRTLEPQYSLHYIARIHPPDAVQPLRNFLSSLYAQGLGHGSLFFRENSRATFALEVLAEYGDKDTYSLMIRGLSINRDTHIDLNNRAMSQIIESCPTSAIRDSLSELDGPVLTAVLGAWNNDACRQALSLRDLEADFLRLLDHPRREVAIAASELLWQQLGDGFIPRAWRMVTTDLHVISDVLWPRMIRRDSPVLVPLADRDWPTLSTDERLDLLPVFHRIGDADSTALLHRALFDAEFLVSARACDVLLRDPTRIDRLSIQSLLQSERPEQRLHAVVLCGYRGWLEGIPAGIPFLVANDIVDAGEAASALGRLRAREAIPALLPLLHNTTEEWLTVRQVAIIALSAIGDPTAAPHLNDAAADAGPEISALTLLALEHLQSPLAPTFRSAAEARCSAEALDAHLESNRDWFDEEMSLVCPATTPEPVPSAAPADP